MAAARAAETEARQQHMRLEQLTTEYTDRQAEAERMQLLRAQLRTDIEATKKDVVAYRDLQLLAEHASHAEVDARRAHDQITTVINSVAKLRVERAALEAAQEARAHELAELHRASGPLLERFHLARNAAENAGKAVAEVQQRAKSVTTAQAYVEDCAHAERLQARVMAYDTAATTLVDLRAAASTITAPTRADLETLRDAAAQVQVLQAAIAESALSLEVDAARDITVDVITGQNPGNLSVAAGTTATIVAADDTVVIDLPGFGRIRARGTDGAANARIKLQPLMELLATAQARYGSASIPELAARTERAAELKRNVTQSERAIAELLGDSSIETIRESLAGARVRIASIERDRPEWRNVRPDAHALRAAFDRDLQTVTDASTLAGIELKSAEELKNDVEKSIASLTTLAAGLTAQIAAHAAQLGSLEADGLDDAARSESAKTLALSWAGAKAQQAEFAQRLARFPEIPEVALERLERTEREAGVGYETALGAATTFRTQLDMQAALGSYAKLAAAEEYAARCESELDAAMSQASAIRCLCDAFKRIQAERLASVIGPVTTASTRYLTRIVGAPMGNIDISPGLSPLGVIDAASGQRLPIDGTLSSGEKEQVYLATRLALAEVIAKDRGRQLFVIDDAAVATDPNRLRRFVALLEELSHEHFQVIVTTSDPSRYLGVRDAKRVDLGAALLGEYAA
jgi:DNA repair exonuclease SbcCD ATPase subunit